MKTLQINNNVDSDIVLDIKNAIKKFNNNSDIKNSGLINEHTIPVIREFDNCKVIDKFRGKSINIFLCDTSVSEKYKGTLKYVCKISLLHKINSLYK